MTLREILESLGMPSWMLNHPNLEKVVVIPGGPVTITDQEEDKIYLY